MKIEDILAQERRARMAAERLLAQKQAELSDANRVLSKHALSLSNEIIETRGVVEVIRGENTQVRTDLENANKEVAIAKRRLWDSLETVEDGFAVFDQANRMIAANSAYLEPFDGLQCVAPGIHYAEILNIATEEGIVDIGNMRPLEWRDMMLGRWHATRIEPVILRLWDGTHIKLVDRRSRDGDMVCLGLNITETIDKENQLMEARHKAEAASRAKSAFLANMSHEIRTPMNGVVALADLMSESVLDEEQKLYVDTIRKSGEALLAIINDVLDYSKIEASKLTLHPETFDLERTVHDVVTLLQPSAQEKGIQVSIDVDIFMPELFVGDVARIRQILTNLIGNAIKFTPSGQVLVRVVGFPVGDCHEQKVHVTVEDTGIGIPKDMQKHIFGEFNQIEDERNRKFEGTGLGLAITRQLIELMDGEIWVESDVGKGACFGFHISLAVKELIDQPALPDNPGTVLVAMKDGLDRSILANRLRAFGFDVQICTDLQELLSTNTAPAFLFVDDMSGLDAPQTPHHNLLGDVRRLYPKLPIYVLLPPQQIGSESHRFSAPATRVIPTPLSRSNLFNILATLSEPVPPTNDQILLEARGDAEAPPVRQMPNSDRRANGAQHRLMRVMAAEDNKTNRFLFTKLVRELDIELRFATNGREAVEVFQTFRPDLVFMDISMPGVDGKEATRNIRKLEADQGGGRARIVALTAHAMAGDAEEIMSHGLDEHLTKPLEKAVIFDEILTNCPKTARCPLPNA